MWKIHREGRSVCRQRDLGGCRIPTQHANRSSRCFFHQHMFDLPDLKPENLLYKSTDTDSPLILADFGIAKALQSKDQALMSMAGSYGYAAPEILLQSGHSKPADLWSLGYLQFQYS
jgi:serine/threonine protein kinase